MNAVTAFAAIILAAAAAALALIIREILRLLRARGAAKEE